ncbi:hypothetical protein Hanom_Chr01g00093481 [Helianthus anomalus]
MNPNIKICALVGSFGRSEKKSVKKKSPQEKEEKRLRRFGPFGTKQYESPVGDLEEYMGDKHSIRPP